MYAIIETGGKQYWVTPGELLKVERMDAGEGQEITLPAIWTGKEGEVTGCTFSGDVTAEVVRHLRAKKVLVFKKRPKKGYKKMQGHRQIQTEIRIKEIQPSGSLVSV